MKTIKPLIENDTQKEYFDQIFESIDLSEKTIEEKVFENCRFIKCDFSEAVLQKCRFCDCKFEHCNLSVVKIKNCSFNNVEFSDSKVTEADFSFADNYRIDLLTCKISKAKFMLPEAIALLHELDIELVEAI